MKYYVRARKRKENCVLVNRKASISVTPPRGVVLWVGLPLSSHVILLSVPVSAL
jgi:hypothetical protein